MSAALFIVSRRGAEEAEIAEFYVIRGSFPSAAFGFSAPLRETNSVLQAGVVL
jgi:hypothetical protein